MYTRSAAFDAAIANSQTVVTVVDVTLNGAVVKAALSIVSGAVEVDGTANVRRRISLVVADGDGTALAALSPYGRELRVYRGVRYPDGTTETVPLGVFRISTVSVNDGGDQRQIAVTGFDRARSVARARFESPYTVAAGTNYGTAIRDLLLSRVPTLITSFTPTTQTTPILVFDQGTDPWQVATEMAVSIGCDLYFDPTGNCVLAPIPDPLNAAVTWSYVAGQGATVLSVNNDTTDEPGYNGVVVDGEPPNLAPVHALAYDFNNSSPTFANGPYGKVPKSYRSQYVTTLDQAQTTADAMLRAERGGTEQLKFSAVPHPAHEVSDLVRVTDTRIGVDDNYILESFTVPLDLAPMTCVTRKRRAA